ncbi:MAG: hypothetical protein JKX73_06595, partial [Flavobacteriales bacterium]|nr:hypothetical protein [Flavobacteriales bacterium]
WTESTASDWISSLTSPINGTYSLKHNLASVAGTGYIYASLGALNLATATTTWRFQLANEAWDPSGGNKFWTFIMANETNLSGGTVDGYAVGVNLTGTTDMLTLWKVTNGAADVAVVTSTFDWNSSTTAGIEVTRTTAGLWELKYDGNGGFDALVSAGTATNTDYTTATYFGLEFTYTSTRAGKLRMDDVNVTQPSGGDTDSEASIPTAQVSAGTIASTVTTVGASVNMFKFDIDDLGSPGDGFATEVTNIRIKPHTTNTADWTDHIQGLRLNNGAITIGAPTITDTYIDIPITAGNLDIANGGSTEITLGIYLNTSLIVDGAILSFMIDANPNGWTADGSTSTFNATFTGGDFNSNDFTITVSATKLVYTTIPSSAGNATNFTIVVSATDANGNVDTDEATSVTLALASGAGTLSSVAGLTQTLVSGVYTWTDIQHNTDETITIEAQSGTLTNITSGGIVISSNPCDYSDDFNRADNSTSAGGTWSQSGGGDEILSNQLRFVTDGASGLEYIYEDVNTYYETVFNNISGELSWTFNMR